MSRLGGGGMDKKTNFIEMLIMCAETLSYDV